MQASGSSHSNLHICKVCGRSLTSPYKLREHMMIHTGEKPHVCTECKQAFRTKPDLARHMRIHTGERPYSCTLCGQRFHRSDNLRGHMKVHKDKGMFPCQTCGEQFFEMNQLVKHRFTIHRTLTNTGLPNNANYSSSTISPPIKTGLPGMGSSNPAKSASETVTEDEVVDLTTPSNSLVTKSDKVITRKGISAHTAILRPDDLVLMAEPAKGQYMCNECGSRFYQKGGLAMHLKLVHGARSRSTSPSVSIPSSSPSPREMILASETAYLCNACGQSFNTLSDLEAHRATVHASGDKTQSVDMNENHTMVDENMNEADSDKDDAVWMVEVDSDVEGSDGVYPNDVNHEAWEDCEKLNVDANKAMWRDIVGDPISEGSSGLTMKVVASDGSVVMVGAEKPFGCEECGLRFAWKQDLNRHTIMSHSGQVPYRCTACGKGFLRQDRLISHIRVHTGKSPHTCEHCAKSFTASSSLKEHMKIHTGEKPHHCSFCGKDFRQKCVLTRHIRNVHKTNVIPDGNAGSGDDQCSYYTADGVIGEADTDVADIVPENEDDDDDGDDSDDDQPMDFSVSTTRSLSSSEQEVCVRDGATTKSVELASSISSTNGTTTTYITNTPVLLEHLNNSPFGIEQVATLRNSVVDDKKVDDGSLTDTGVSSGSQMVRSCAACGTKFSSIGDLSIHLMTHHVLKVQGSDSIHQQHTHPKTYNNAVPNVVIKQEPAGSLLALTASGTIGEVLIKHEDIENRSPSDDNANDLQCSQQCHLKPQHNFVNVRSSSKLSLLHSSGEQMQHNSKFPIKCSLCGLTFNTSQELSKHTDTHVKSDPFFCSLCSDTFRSTSALDEHIKTHSVLIKNIQDLKDNDSAPEGGVACNICREQLEEESELSEHMKMHCPGHGSVAHSCSLCESSFETPELMNKHIGQQHSSDISSGDTSDLRLYGCNFCFKPFKKIRTLVLHLKTHLTHKPFVCDMCGKAFSQKIYLTQHMRTHTGERPYMCTVCGRSFTQKTQLTIHERSHRGETPYHCSKCTKAFTNKSVLKLHMTTHMSLPPFRCTLCDRRFTQAGNVRRHISMVHKDVESSDKIHYTNDNQAESDEDMEAEEPVGDFTQNTTSIVSQPLDLSNQLSVESQSNTSADDGEDILDGVISIHGDESDTEDGVVEIDGIKKEVYTVMDNDDLLAMGAYYNQQPGPIDNEPQLTEKLEEPGSSGNKLKDRSDLGNEEECVLDLTDKQNLQKQSQKAGCKVALKQIVIGEHLEDLSGTRLLNEGVEHVYDENTTDSLRAEMAARQSRIKRKGSAEGKRADKCSGGNMAGKCSEIGSVEHSRRNPKSKEGLTSGESVASTSSGGRIEDLNEESNVAECGGAEVFTPHTEMLEGSVAQVKEDDSVAADVEVRNADKTEALAEELSDGEEEEQKGTTKVDNLAQPVQDSEIELEGGTDKDGSDEVNEDIKREQSVEEQDIADITETHEEITKNKKRKAPVDTPSAASVAKRPKREGSAIDTNEGPSKVSGQTECDEEDDTSATIPVTS